MVDWSMSDCSSLMGVVYGSTLDGCCCLFLLSGVTFGKVFSLSLVNGLYFAGVHRLPFDTKANVATCLRADLVTEEKDGETEDDIASEGHWATFLR